MRQREFLEELSLIREKKIKVDVKNRVLSEIYRRAERKVILRSLALFPVFIFLMFKLVLLLINVNLFNFAVNGLFVPNFIFIPPDVYTYILIISASALSSILISRFIEKEESNEMLLSSR